MPIGPFTKTVQNVVDRVTRTFGDESGAQVTTTDIIAWINSGQAVINKKNRILKDKATTPLIIGTREYTFPTPNILEIESLQVSGRPIDYRSFKEASDYVLENDPTFTSTGTPFMWYEWGGSILLYPTPDTVVDLTLYYIKYPVAVDDVTDTLSLPDSYYEPLLDYCLKQAYEQDDDWTGSANKSDQFEKGVADLSQDTSRVNRQYYSTITVIDEDEDWY